MRAAAVLLSGALAAAAVGAAMADEAAKTDGAVRAVTRQMDAAWNAGDAVKFAALWAENGIVISPMGELTEGRSQIQADMAGQFAGPLKGTTHRLDVERVFHMRSGVAVADGEATVRGAEGTPWAAHFTAVFGTDADGRWLVHHMVSYNFISR